MSPVIFVVGSSPSMPERGVTQGRFLLRVAEKRDVQHAIKKIRGASMTVLEAAVFS